MATGLVAGMALATRVDASHVVQRTSLDSVNYLSQLQPKQVAAAVLVAGGQKNDAGMINAYTISADGNKIYLYSEGMKDSAERAVAPFMTISTKKLVKIRTLMLRLTSPQGISRLTWTTRRALGE